jgi:uncharacterized protein (TIGR03437 family)
MKRINSFIRVFKNNRSVLLSGIAIIFVLGLASELMSPARSEIEALTAAIVRTPAGSGFFGFSGDGGPATNARFSNPNGVAVDAGGNLYIADLFNDRIRKVDTNGVITTFAGRFGGTFGGDGGPATEAGMFDVSGVAVDEKGNVYIADTDNYRVRKVDTTGIISTVAGNGNFGFTGDNVAATQTALASPAAVAVDVAGNIYIADLFNSRIRKVDTQGVITTFAGSGVAGYNGDGGQATQARIDTPEGVAVDRLGNVYIADSASGVVRRVAPSGVITTFAGTGQDGFNGDGGQATQARLSSPRGVAAGADGTVYIGDAGNDRIRQVTPNGVITTVAGNGQTGYNGDGIPAVQASFFEPAGLAVDPFGSVYIADSINDRIRMLKSAQLQFFGLSRYVLPTGASQTINIIGSGLENSMVAINGQGVSSMLDAGSGNLAVSVPLSFLTAPGALSFQVSKAQSQTPPERRVIVAAQSQLNGVPSATVSAASFQQGASAEAIGAMFGTRLATQTGFATSFPLPTSLSGTSVLVNGIASPLFFVSAGQINYQINKELATGEIASVVTVAGDGAVSQGQIQILTEAPGIFTANATGNGGPAAVWTQDGINFFPVSNPDGSPRPLPAGSVVVLFGTGIRNTPALNPTDGNGVAESLRVNLGGAIATPAFAGPQGSLIGLDQVNLPIPNGLAGAGRIDAILIVNGRAANTFQLQIM